MSSGASLGTSSVKSSETSSGLSPDEFVERLANELVKRLSMRRVEDRLMEVIDSIGERSLR